MSPQGKKDAPVITTGLLFSTLVYATAVFPAAAVTVAAQSDFRPAPAGAVLLGDMKADQRVTLAIVLPLRNQRGAADFIDRVGKIGNPLYHRYLTPQGFADRFGGDASAYAAAASWATGKGMTVGEASISRTILPVTGSAAQIEAAFGVHLNEYRTENGQEFFSADRAPSLPQEISGTVSSVLGFSNLTRYAPLVRTNPAGKNPDAGGTGPGGSFSAADLRKAYSILPQSPSKPSETMAVFEQGGFYPSDVAVYLAYNKLPKVPVAARNVGTWKGGVNDPSVEVEAVLDIDLEIALNPAAKDILVYEDGDDPFGVALLLSLTAMANDNKADTISISYGTDEIIQGDAQIAAENPLFMQLAAQGQTVFVSSGDGGAYGRTGNGLNAPDPGSQPYVTCVGGTSLLVSTRDGSYEHEGVYDELNSGGGATGGGVSSYWHLPAYQRDANGKSVAIGNGGSATHRNVPDVAAVGAPSTGAGVYSKIAGGWLEVGGTSVSSPIWAGYFSLMNAASKAFGTGRIGFYNPRLYPFAEIGVDGNGSSLFNDVLDGTNGDQPVFGIPGFYAGTGYDNTTGWGSMIGNTNLISFVASPIAAGTNPPPFPHGLYATATATTTSLHWTASAGAKSYLILANNLSGTSENPPYTITFGTSFEYRNLLPSTDYGFVVYAVDAGGLNGSIVYSVTRK